MQKEMHLGVSDLWEASSIIPLILYRQSNMNKNLNTSQNQILWERKTEESLDIARAQHKQHQVILSPTNPQ